MIYGLSGTGAQATQIGGAAAGAATSSAVTAGWITAAAGGVIGLAIAGIVAGLMALFSRKGPQQKIQASNFANEVEPYFVANLKAWEASPQTLADQQTALAGFDRLWAETTKEWSNPAYGEPGQRAIQERGRDGRPHWGKNWFELYRDPIANAQVKEAGTGLIDAVSGISGSVVMLGLAAVVGLSLVLD